MNFGDIWEVGGYSSYAFAVPSLEIFPQLPIYRNALQEARTRFFFPNPPCSNSFVKCNKIKLAEK